VPTAALERALFLESDRMGYLLGAITQAKLDEQRGVVQNEKRQGDNQPYGLLSYQQLAGLFPPGHPYAHDTIGSMADLDAASLQTVKDWFRDHYGPNNAVLVLAGDIDMGTARPLVAKYFGAIPRGPQTRTPAAPVPTLPSPKREAMQDRVAATLLTRSWVGPGLNDPDAAALDVAAGVLGGLSASRLDNALVRRERLTTQVSANYEDFAQLGQFEINALVRPGADVAAAERRLDAIIADFIRTGPTADEVTRYVTRTVAGRIDGLEAVGGFGGKAVALAEGALYSNDPGFFRKRLERLAKQTPETVRAAMGRWLTRPVYALNVVPGARSAYEDAKVPPRAEVTPAPETPAQGTRGPLPPVGQVAALRFPAVARARLSNGMEVVYAQRTAVPVTQAVISFDAGVAADVPDKLGTQGVDACDAGGGRDRAPRRHRPCRGAGAAGREHRFGRERRPDHDRPRGAERQSAAGAGPLRRRGARARVPRVGAGTGQGADAGRHRAGTDQPAGLGEPRDPGPDPRTGQPLCQGAGRGRSEGGGFADPRRSDRLSRGLAPSRQSQNFRDLGSAARRDHRGAGAALRRLACGGRGGGQAVRRPPPRQPPDRTGRPAGQSAIDHRRRPADRGSAERRTYWPCRRRTMRWAAASCRGSTWTCARPRAGPMG
jgi:predicted Zn-dependent peptidase